MWRLARRRAQRRRGLRSPQRDAQFYPCFDEDEWRILDPGGNLHWLSPPRDAVRLFTSGSRRHMAEIRFPDGAVMAVQCCARVAVQKEQDHYWHPWRYPPGWPGTKRVRKRGNFRSLSGLLTKIFGR